MKIMVLAKKTLAHGLGGMEVHLDHLCRELIAAGHEVRLITSARPVGEPSHQQRGMETLYLPGAPAGQYSRAWWRGSREAFERSQEQDPADLLLSESLAAAAVATVRTRPRLYAFLYGLTRDHLVSEWHEGSGLPHFAKYALRRAPETLYYSTFHERPFLRRIDGAIATYDHLVPRLRGKCRRVLVSYNGVDTTVFRPAPQRGLNIRKRHGIPEQAVVTTMAATLNRQKGIHLGIEAVAPLTEEFPGLRVLVLGEGPSGQGLRAMVASDTRLEGRVEFAGAVPRAEMPAYMNASDLFLHPSSRVEGLPTVIAEAMASGLPVVATDTGGTLDAVQDGETGFLVPRADVGRLTGAIRGILSDDQLASRLGADALRAARERFAWSIIVKRLLADLSQDLELP